MLILVMESRLGGYKLPFVVLRGGGDPTGVAEDEDLEVAGGSCTGTENGKKWGVLD